jgi:hypothetical protein
MIRMSARGGVVRAGPGEADLGRDGKPGDEAEGCWPSKSHGVGNGNRLEQLRHTGRLSSHCLTRQNLSTAIFSHKFQPLLFCPYMSCSHVWTSCGTVMLVSVPRPWKDS